ncbi:MAG: acetyltransferase [Desulfobacteraceae bacterium]|jgi:sugar O-acyltransferase (sialic acid O-acetyltransferase NeuD family)|nr:acetyltransferase [Desulfobacteraceae bacterium]
MKSEKILIFGAGGFAREVAWLIEAINKNYEIQGFIDDTHDQHEKIINNIPVFGLDEAYNRFPFSKIVVAVGDPCGREVVVAKSKNKNFLFESIIHPKTEMSKWIEMGEGTIICAGNILTTNINIGKHVHINLNCTIGHNVNLGDFNTLAPGVHISGWVNTGKRVYIGTGAVIINGKKDKPIFIEDDVIIGAGACVTKSLLKNNTYVGVPAKVIRT